MYEVLLIVTRDSFFLNFPPWIGFLFCLIFQCLLLLKFKLELFPQYGVYKVGELY